MRNFDPSSLYRSTVGFDRLFDLMDTASRVEPLNNWPPYNIERLGEDRYQISLAVAGFSGGEIAVTAEQNTVTIEGRKAGLCPSGISLAGLSRISNSRRVPATVSTPTARLV